MQYNDLMEDKVLSTPLKPFSCFPSKIPEYFPFVPSHWHKEFEINYVLSGRAVHTTDGCTVHSNPGDIFLITPGVLHAIAPDDGNYVVYDTLTFDLDFLISSPKERSAMEYLIPVRYSQKRLKDYFCPDDPDYSTIHELILHIFDAAKKDTAASDLLLKSRLNELFFFMVSHGYCMDHTISQRQSEILYSMRLVIQYIAENYHSNIRISELAAQTCLCESSFMTAFHKTFGITATEYIMQYRIQNACNLLQNTSKSILEIAADCGYQNLSNFNRLFKRTTGQTPREYRKEHHPVSAAAIPQAER